ncbi:MAG: hypothetical protein ACKVP0_25715 [Pirellulaceae bacterium]
MFRFSIREMMLVTLVVAISVAWAIDHWRPSNVYRKMDLENTVMEEGLKFLGYEVKEEWPGVRIDRNNERPFIVNTSQSPGATLIVGGQSPPYP